VGPFFWLFLSNYISRPSCVFWGMLATAAMCIWSATSTQPNAYTSFVISRWLAGTFGSVGTALGAGIIFEVGSIFPPPQVDEVLRKYRHFTCTKEAKRLLAMCLATCSAQQQVQLSAGLSLTGLGGLFNIGGLSALKVSSLSWFSYL